MVRNSETATPANPTANGYVRVEGVVRLPATCADPFELFTPNGERAWVHDWDPQYPTPTPDDSAPGTVFEIVHGGQRATWIVCQRKRGTSIQYARVLPGDHAGMVTVTLGDDSEGTFARVEYRLTALADEAVVELQRFAAQYPAFLEHWETSIARACGQSEAVHRDHPSSG